MLISLFFPIISLFPKFFLPAFHIGWSGLGLQNRIRNEDLRKRTNIKDARTLATHTKWKWAGHVMRMGQNRWAHKTTTWDPRTGHRNVGSQKRRWTDDLKLHFGSTKDYEGQGPTSMERPNSVSKGRLKTCQEPDHQGRP